MRATRHHADRRPPTRERMSRPHNELSNPCPAKTTLFLQRKNLVKLDLESIKKNMKARMAVEEIYNDVAEGADVGYDYYYMIIIASSIAGLGLA